MKRKLENYSFSKQEIIILKQIASENHLLSSLTKSLSIKPSLLSHYLKKLQEKAIIKFQKAPSFKKRWMKSKKLVYFRDSKHSVLLKELLTTYPHIKWEEILSGLGIEVLFQILSNSGATENLSPVTFWRYSKNFMALGIMEYSGENFRINNRFSLLINFLEEYERFIINTVVRSVSESAKVIWQKDFECLIRVPNKVRVVQKGFTKTATSCFHVFGIQLISDFDIYIYSKRKAKICIEDIILHTLLIERENVRYVTYSLLLLRKKLKEINRGYLLKRAMWYGLSLQINAMLEFLKTKGVRTGSSLPTWDEFRVKMREYEEVA
jgi:hypothetical protein